MGPVHPQSPLLFLIDTAYDRKSWHGTNLRGSIRGVTLRQAAWRPARGRHNIWELVVHAAYWKYVAWRRLTGGARGSFPIEGSDWFTRPRAPTAQAWRDDIALLEQMHRTLRDAVARLATTELAAVGELEVSGARRKPQTNTVSTLALVTGVAAHDLYHAGQIQLLKRLAG